MSPTQSPEDILASARMRAAQAMPYFRPAIYKLIPVSSPGLGTFGVTERWHLLWDPGVVADWGVDHVATVILHEIMHPLRDHAARYRTVMGVTKGEVDEFIARPSGTPRAAVQDYMRLHRTWNICADCEINACLVAAGRKFPDGFCWLGEKLTPPQPRGLLAEEYWAAIDREAPQDPDSGDAGESGEPSPGNGPGGDGDSAEGEGDPSGGQCGSGATGVPTPAEKGIPGDNPGRSPAEVRAIIRHAAGQVRKHSQGAGSVPGGLDRWAAEILAPPKVTWDQILRRSMRGGIARVKGAMDTSYSTISRRQQAMGHGSGTVILPASHAYAPRIWVAVDTSASMGPKDVGDALSEVGGILKVVECDVTFSSVDAKVQATTTVRTMRDLASSVLGGGGTDFRPLMKAVDEAREKPHILVVLTDGDGPAPAKPPKGVEIIWVLIGRYKRKPRGPQGDVGYGTFIELD